MNRNKKIHACVNETMEQYLERQIKAFEDEDLFLPLNIDHEQKIFHMMFNHPELSRFEALKVYKAGLNVARQVLEESTI